MAGGPGFWGLLRQRGAGGGGGGWWIVAADVWQVEWNLLGSWLAASTEGGEVLMWRPDLSGEWLLLNRLFGEQQQQEQGMVA